MAAAVVLLAACANMGRPEGGPRDETPPVFVRANPGVGALNVDQNRIDIYFDENIKLENIMDKLVVSPVQKQVPQAIANGRHLRVELRDTLIPDATYTLDFSDAIRDLNEGNILDGFAMDFSTGETRDSLSISGMLFEARTLEPAQGMLVGVHSNLEDSALTKLQFNRIAKTNQLGQFTIRNLAPGQYRLYAVNDVNRDYRWDRSEDVAFYDLVVEPSVEDIVVSDTLRASDGADSIVTRPGSRYLPNDILLTWFNENYRSQYLKNYSRTDSTRLVIEFGAPSDTFPTLTIVNGPRAGATLAEIGRLDHSWARDSLEYWLTDPEVIHQDTLVIAANYLRTDTLNNLTWTNDTLKFINKIKPQKEKKKKDKNKEKNDSVASDSLPQLTFLDFSTMMKGTQEVNMPLRFKSSQPLDSINNDAIHLEIKEDSLWVDLGPQKLTRDSLNRQLDYSLHVDWLPGETYRFRADSASIFGIYDQWNRPISQEITTRKLEEYSTLTLKLVGAPDSLPMVVELLNSSDKPLTSVRAANGEARFEYILPGAYYVRAFVDVNDNGTWDTGNIEAHSQPEDTYYYPKKINVKKNWDISQQWNINELPVDLQKPLEIKKNKPKTKDRDQRRGQNGDEDEDEEDEFGDGFGYGNDRFGGGSNRNPNRGSGFRGLGGEQSVGQGSFRR